jgi:hypothetical protein
LLESRTTLKNAVRYELESRNNAEKRCALPA